MTYLREEQLKKDHYYLVETYDGELAVLGYYGQRVAEYNPHCWGLNKSWGHIRYALCEMDNLDDMAIKFR